MYLDVSKITSAKGKAYSRVLLRSSYREDGKVRHRTLGNLSGCSSAEIEAVRLALKHKDQLAALLAGNGVTPPPHAGQGIGLPGAPFACSDGAGGPAQPFGQGPSVGAIVVLRGIAEALGIVAALGDDIQGRLALWQVIARALDQGSRLSAVRLARDLGSACILGLPSFDEDALYDNLDWLQNRQETIETSLFARHYEKEKRV